MWQHHFMPFRAEHGEKLDKINRELEDEELL